MFDLSRLFLSRNAAFIGMDIGRHAVRMVELSRRKTGVFVLRGYGSEHLAEGAVTDDGIDDLEHVMNAASRLWERSAFKARKVAIGIPPAAVTERTFHAGRGQPDARLEALAKEHIAPLLDYHVTDACIDFCVLEAASQLAGQVEVLVAATRRENVEDRLAVAEFLKLHAIVAEAESHAAHVAGGRANPFSDMVLAAGIDAGQLQAEGSNYLVACGLALRGFD
ncbi:type IV pilus biogenesis protein PilM [Herbaspirillum rhizosphaerae]|uniref:type IV pilus biogenesis protein PilM n=1 Tax=Herbaspirillum rhizosphaerae TaxID=346179 RepID=UPI00067D4B1A|nr:pilus assembly protein PilM [Herbaspirillum rhizosphaerae]